MNKDYLKLHLIILVLAFTGLLGDLISIHAMDLVWYRTFFGAVGLFIWGYIASKKSKNKEVIIIDGIVQKATTFKLKKKNIRIYLLVGLTIGLHWFCFFHAIDISNISVGIGCLSSATLFASFLEPIFFKKKVKILDIVTSIVIIIGLYTIFQFETTYTEGIIYATISAFFAALFTVLNKKYVSGNGDPFVSVTFYEILGAWICMSLLLTSVGSFEVWTFQLSSSDWIYLLVLGFICTSYTFVANIELLQRLSAFVVVLSYNLEPIYGMVIGKVKGEEMTTGFYFGAIIILSAIFLYPLLNRKLS